MSNEHTPLWGDERINSEWDRQVETSVIAKSGHAFDLILTVRDDYQAELAALRARIVELEVQLHESERSWTVSTAKYRKYKAKELLVHYFKLVMNRSGVGWDWDNELEINDIVDLIVEAAVLEATTPKEQPHE
jgi:hypothetical protein